ncbi:hypothetical protein L0152_30325 [bacterium]|nr:hypothetical protein [bacterium]
MKEITDKKFMELSRNQGSIDVDHMSDDLKKSLASAGLSEAELRKIADSDGKITDKEFQKLFQAVDRFDSNPSKASFDYYEKSSSSKSPVLSKSGQLYEAMSREVQRNRTTASYPGSAIVPASKEPIVGRQIAIVTNGSKTEPVKVTKELGQPNGFATRYEALALARGANSGSAAIFQDDKTKRWYAVETNTPLQQGSSTWSPESKRISNLEFAGQPDLTKWKEARKKVDELKSQGKTLDDFELRSAYGDMIAVALGVPKTEIKIMDKSDKPDPNKINFNPWLPALGRSGPAKLDGKPHDIQIGIGELSSDTPFNLIGTVHHEATHVHHHARGNELLKQWEGTDKSKTFGQWLDAQYQKKKITLEERETITAEYNGKTGPTEAISYLNTFMATFAVDRAGKDDNLMLNSNLNQVAKFYASDDDLSKELRSRLEYFYRGLDDADRARFQTVMDKFKKDNPTSWLAKFQY